MATTKADRPMNEYEAALLAGLQAVVIALADDPATAEPLYRALQTAERDAEAGGSINGAAMIRMLLDLVPSFPRD